MESNSLLLKPDYKKCKDAIMAVLGNYRDLLKNNDSVLITDAYIYTPIQIVRNYLKWHVIKGANRKLVSGLTDFYEPSNCQKLKSLLGKKIFHTCGTRIAAVETDNLLANKMELMVFNRRDIEQIIEHINHMPKIIFWIRKNPVRHLTCVIDWMLIIALVIVRLYFELLPYMVQYFPV